MICYYNKCGDVIYVSNWGRKYWYALGEQASGLHFAIDSNHIRARDTKEEAQADLDFVAKKRGWVIVQGQAKTCPTCNREHFSKA